MKSSSLRKTLALCFTALTLILTYAVSADAPLETPTPIHGGDPGATPTTLAHVESNALPTHLSYATIGTGALVLVLLLAGARHYSRTGMQRWNVNSRLVAGFTCILIVLSGLAVESYVSLHSAFREFKEYRSDARHSNLANAIHSEYLEMRIAAKDLIVFRTQEAAQRYAVHKTALVGYAKEGKASIQEPELLLKIEAIQAGIEKHAALHLELQKAVFANQDTAAAEINKQMGAIGAVIGNEAEAIRADFIGQQNEEGPRTTAALQYTQSAVVWLGLAAVVLGAALAVIIAHSITGPLRRFAESIGAGAEQTAAAAGQVSAASQSLAEGTSEQAASLEETSATLEELSSMTKRNADNSQQAKTAATAARSSADTGAGQMQAMQNAMQTIKSASDDITKILKTIDEIAFQTNILALNAAVEAARAGEHGAGFAVVADEVRALAHRSAAAAKETAVKIEYSVAQSQHGVHVSAEVARSFTEIQTRIQQLDALVAEIASASSEQNVGIGQVATAVTQMDKVTQNNAANAEETAAASEELSSQAITFNEVVGQLQVMTGIKAAHTSDHSGPAPAARPAGKKHAPTPRSTEQSKAVSTSHQTPAIYHRSRPVLAKTVDHESSNLDHFFKEQ